jgi:hypothetical protein
MCIILCSLIYLHYWVEELCLHWHLFDLWYPTAKQEIHVSRVASVEYATYPGYIFDARPSVSVVASADRVGDLGNS